MLGIDWGIFALYFLALYGVWSVYVDIRNFITYALIYHQIKQIIEKKEKEDNDKQD